MAVLAHFQGKSRNNTRTKDTLHTEAARAMRSSKRLATMPRHSQGPPPKRDSWP